MLRNGNVAIAILMSSQFYVFFFMMCCFYDIVPSVNAGSVYTGVDFCKRLCGVSVIRRYKPLSKCSKHKCILAFFFLSKS
jgi:hypothetical protein